MHDIPLWEMYKRHWCFALRWCVLVVTVTSFNITFSQQITIDSANKVLKATPAFTMYKDNYIITGTTVRETPTPYNSDAKFQISFRHRVTRTTLPFDSYLFVAYTQRSFWNVYRDSRPFTETNYHPAVGIAKLISKDQHFKGTASIMVEHESNGRGIATSVSWNYISLNYIMMVSPKTTAQFRLWIPFYSRDLADLMKYAGFIEARYMREITENKFHIALTGRKGSTWDWIGNIQTELYYNPFKSSNQYIFLQWFYGYAENLMEFQRRKNMLRIGVAIRPDRLMFY